MKKVEMRDLYAKGKQLDQGNFGTTYMCTKIATGHQYACKCISKHNLISKKEHEKVELEIEILRLINLQDHPNIISIKDVLEDEKNVYIVMEFCDGGTLFDNIVEWGAFTEARATKTIKEVVSAIEACHSFGIIHRDLKLENLMFQTIGKELTIKVIDFGLAQFFENDKMLTNVVGSPIYIAPEVVEGHYGPKADIWSVGIVLYILLVGFYPFDAETFKRTYKEIIEDIQPWFEKNPWPNISKSAKDLIKKMLKYNVDERLSASEVLKHPWIKKMSSSVIEKTS